MKYNYFLWNTQIIQGSPTQTIMRTFFSILWSFLLRRHLSEFIWSKKSVLCIITTKGWTVVNSAPTVSLPIVMTMQYPAITPFVWSFTSSCLSSIDHHWSPMAGKLGIFPIPYRWASGVCSCYWSLGMKEDSLTALGYIPVIYKITL